MLIQRTLLQYSGSFAVRSLSALNELCPPRLGLISASAHDLGPMASLLPSASASSFGVGVVVGLASALVGYSAYKTISKPSEPHNKHDKKHHHTNGVGTNGIEGSHASVLLPRPSDEWEVEWSPMAARTVNHIRSIVETLDEKNANPSKDIIKLSIGDPAVFGNMNPNEAVIQAVKDALDNPHVHGTDENTV